MSCKDKCTPLAAVVGNSVVSCLHIGMSDIADSTVGNLMKPSAAAGENMLSLSLNAISMMSAPTDLRCSVHACQWMNV